MTTLTTIPAKVNFVAVKFYTDEESVEIVRTRDVVDFVPMDSYKDKPFFVWKEFNEAGQLKFKKVPAQILAVAESKKDLAVYTSSDKEKLESVIQQSFVPRRYSDAVELILQREASQNNLKEKQDSPINKKSKKGKKEKKKDTKKKERFDKDPEAQSKDKNKVHGKPSIKAANNQKKIAEKAKQENAEKYAEVPLTKPTLPAAIAEKKETISDTSKQNLFDTSPDEREKLAEELLKVKNENKMLKDSNEENIKKLNDMQRDHNSLQESYSNLKTSNDNNVALISNLTNELDSLKNIVHKLAESKAKERQDVHEKVMEIESVQSANMDLDSPKKQPIKRYAALSPECSTKQLKMSYDIPIPVEEDIDVDKESAGEKKKKKKKKNKSQKSSKKEKKGTREEEIEPIHNRQIKQEVICPSIPPKKEKKKGEHGRFTESELNEFRKSATLPEKSSWWQGDKKMYHIACGESISYEDWDRKVRPADSASKHLTSLASVLWPGDQLLDTALDPENCRENRLPGRPPRRAFSPKRLAACQISYDYKCNRKYSGEYLDKEKNKFRPLLSAFVNRLITKEKTRLNEEEKRRQEEEKLRQEEEKLRQKKK